MKTFTLALVTSLLASGAQASGFNCETVEGDLRVKLYHQVQPEMGTRNAAVMIVSDPLVSHGRKTIAKFTSANGTLGSRRSVYTADVDLRFNDSGRQGELISGTKLGELASLTLDIHYYFDGTFEAGAETTAVLQLDKRNGDRIERDMVCTVYLKGE